MKFPAPHPAFGAVSIFRTDSIGDVVLTLPVARAVREQSPGTRVVFVARAYTAPLVRLCPYVDEVIAIEGRDLDGGIRDVVRTLRAARIDAAVFAYPRPRLAWAARRAGIAVRTGTAYRWYSPLFTARVRDHRHDSALHESAYNLRLLEPLGLRAEAARDHLLAIPAALDARAAARLAALGITPDENFVVLHPGSGGSARDWAAGNFGTLGARLAREFPAARMLVTGMTAEADAVHGVARACGPRVAEYFGDDGLDLFAAVLARASLCVANSTGPLHVAAALGVSVVGLYPFDTPCHPRRWGPMTDNARILTPLPDAGCAACARGRCATHDDPARIPVDAVFAAAREMLAGTFPSE